MQLKQLMLTGCILTGNILSYGQIDRLNSNDTLVYYWGKEFHSSTLMLNNNNNTYNYLIKDDLWIHTSYGSFSKSGDTIELTCQTNCSNEFDNVKPVIIELVNSDFTGDAAIVINQLGDTLENYTIKLIDDNKHERISKKIQIWNESNLIYETFIRNLNANGFLIILPISIEHPEYIFFEKKIVMFSNEFLLVDGRQFKRMIHN